MMKDDGRKGPLAALVALKLICCGGLLLATGAFSLGGFLSLMAHPAVKLGGVLLLVLAAGWLLWRVLSIRATLPSQNAGARSPELRSGDAILPPKAASQQSMSSLFYSPNHAVSTAGTEVGQGPCSSPKGK